MSDPLRYHAIWPGQPGGYVAVLGDELAAKASYKPPKPPAERMSMPGLSAAADAAVPRYRAKGIEIEEARKKAREGKGKKAKPNT